MGSGCTLGCPGRASRQQTGSLEQRVWDTLVTSTLQLPEHLTPEQTHSHLTHQLRPQGDNSLTLHTSHMWQAALAPLDTRRPCAHAAPGGFWKRNPQQRQGAAAPSRGALGLLDQRACWRRGPNKRKWPGPCRLAQEPGKKLSTKALWLSGQHPDQGDSWSSGGLLSSWWQGHFPETRPRRRSGP